ncbi:unnamed protein product [Rhizoctonia solani]|uniref:Transmembrane protein n=1 Tax=Rhizoctonia solani TaxID=456999 RepID=A0A8H3BIG8_9AGAM|nr:unnamed protein product [Rhizoctonia solani]
MSSNTPPITWLLASAWLATNCFAFNMSSLGASSYWVIPSALVATAFHHGFMFRYLRRNPGQAIPRKYIYTFPLVILLWISGAGLSIYVGSWTVQWEYYSGPFRVAISTLISGALSIIEAGLVIELWRRCAKMKSNGMARSLPLGSLDNLDRNGVKP